MAYSEKTSFGQASHPIIGWENASIPENIRVVGSSPIILKNFYDSSQFWFEFMSGAIFPTYLEEAPIPPKKIKNTTYVSIEDKCRKLYPTDSCYNNQWVLPFIEGKRITNSEFTKMKIDGFHSWDKDSDGCLYVLHIEAHETRLNIEEWCKNNCRLRFYINSNKRIFFQCANDFIIARLRF